MKIVLMKFIGLGLLLLQSLPVGAGTSVGAGLHGGIGVRAYTGLQDSVIQFYQQSAEAAALRSEAAARFGVEGYESSVMATILHSPCLIRSQKCPYRALISHTISSGHDEYTVLNSLISDEVESITMQATKLEDSGVREDSLAWMLAGSEPETIAEIFLQSNLRTRWLEIYEATPQIERILFPQVIDLGHNCLDGSECYHQYIIVQTVVNTSEPFEVDSLMVRVQVYGEQQARIVLEKVHLL